MTKRHLYKDEIKKLLIMYCISFIVISIVLVYSFLGVYTNLIVRNRNNDSNNLARSFLENEIEEYGKSIRNFGKQEAILSYLQTGDNQAQVYELLYAFINKMNAKSIFYIVNTEGKTILTNNYVKSPYNSYEIFLSGLFKKLKANTDEIVYMNNKVQIDNTRRTIYSIGKTIKIDGKIKGYLIFDILESDLKKIIYNIDVDILVITDQYNNVIITTNSLVLDDIGKFTLIKNAKNSLKFMNKEYYFYKSKLLDGQMFVYTLSELELISNLMTKSVIFFVIIMSILSLIIIKVAGYASSKKTKSIEQLINSINKVQKGDLKAFVSIKSNDEFELIGEQFNKMLYELNDLIVKNNELINRNRISQIKQLESQFNPHFIFNTLETLKYMIYIDQKKASDIIVNFAIILRYSIDYEKKLITLDQDLDYLKSYLFIQKYRYNRRLTYDICIDKNAKQCVVPKLIMQPIIENCINHGYKSKETLHIILDISIIKGKLVMIIKDDGDGISEEKLIKLRQQLEDESIETNRIGLNNVHRRLKLLYGESYGLTIESKKGDGTVVKIKMPNEKW